MYTDNDLTNILFIFFFNDTATTEIYTLSLHDALPILDTPLSPTEGKYLIQILQGTDCSLDGPTGGGNPRKIRSEEHTSELQSQSNLVCRLLLEKKKKKKNTNSNTQTQQYIDKHNNMKY